MFWRAHEFTNKIGKAWCRMMHDASTWPVNGHYRCRTCMRKFPVPWAETTPRSTPMPSLRRELTPSLTSAYQVGKSS